MKFKIKHLWVVLLASIVLLFTSCGYKTPDEGYLTEDQVDKIVEEFSITTDYKKYSYEGTFNYLGNYLESKDELIPSTASGSRVFTDSLEKYYNKSASYYLRMPLHITKGNWNYFEEVAGKIDNTDSTKYRVESMLLTIGKTLDKVYYYTDAEGNLIIKTFGANKALIINESDIICHGKWNVTIVYDKNGYLVSEKFETINAHKEPKTETCYGEATYKWIA